MDFKAHYAPPFPGAPQTWRIMNMIAVFLFAVCLSASANGFSQKITLNERNASLLKVFREIKKQTGYKFLYTDEVIGKGNPVTLSLKETELRQALEICFRDQPFTWTIIDNTIIIKLKPATIPRVIDSVYRTEVRGKVVNEKGEPAEGVSVMIKGSNKGTTTNDQGEFSLDVPIGTTLVVSAIGYSRQEVRVSNTSLRIVLLPLNAKMDEVVVVGYKAISRGDVTGAIGSLRTGSFNVGLNTSPSDMMQGRVAGLQMITNGGEPGAGVSVKIRGANSVRAGQSPLYVVDGVPLDITDIQPGGASISGAGSNATVNPLNFINPDDIESIDVLKDASAAAIYGARGANGVIIITTRKGKAGKGKMSYSSFVGLSKLPEKLPMMSAREFVAYRASQGVTTDNQGNDIDWQDQIFRSAISQSHSLAYGGGNEVSSYRASASYQKQDGIVRGTSLEKYTGRINMTHNAWDNKLKLEGNLTIGRTNNKRVPIGQTGGYEGDVILSALKMNPTFPIYNADGSYNQPSPDVRNALAMINLTNDRTQTDRMLGNITASLTLARNLVYKINAGLDNSKASRQVTQDYHLTYLPNKGTVNINNVTLSSSIIENYLTYDLTIAGKHKLNAMAGHSYQKFRNSSYGFSENGFNVDGIDYLNNLQLGNYTQAITTSDITENRLQSFFTRINYNLGSKYLLTATMRADGSSKFGENKKYGFFPSASAAWKMSEESFIRDLDIFDNLKFRLGWGITGNQEIPNKISQMLLGTGGPGGLVDGSAVSGLTLVRTPNPDIHWEKTKQWNAGFDFTILNRRLSGTIDLFDKTTTDVLLQVYSIAPAPTTQVWTNVDKMKISNKGLELTLNGVVVDQEKLKVNAGLNFTTIRNKVSGLPMSRITTGNPSGPGITGYTSQVIMNGYPIGTFWGKKFLGFDNNGMSLFQKDEKGADAEMALGNALPKYSYGFNSSVNYRNWDLSVFFYGQQGSKVYNNLANILNQKTLILKGWNATRSAIESPESTGNTLAYSSRFIEDGSFLRLSSATIGYTVNTGKLSAYISKLRFYVAGNNLLTFTSYSGYDPEVNADHSSNGVPSIGIDWTTYPRARTFTAGVNVEF